MTLACARLQLLPLTIRCEGLKVPVRQQSEPMKACLRLSRVTLKMFYDLPTSIQVNIEGRPMRPCRQVGSLCLIPVTSLGLNLQVSGTLV